MAVVLSDDLICSLYLMVKARILLTFSLCSAAAFTNKPAFSTNPTSLYCTSVHVHIHNHGGVVDIWG